MICFSNPRGALFDVRIPLKFEQDKRSGSGYSIEVGPKLTGAGEYDRNGIASAKQRTEKKTNSPAGKGKLGLKLPSA